MSSFDRFYPAKPIYTLIAPLLYFPKIGDICPKLDTSYSVQNYAQQNCGVNITRPKIRLITSAQNCAYLTHLNFGASTFFFDSAKLRSPYLSLFGGRKYVYETQIHTSNIPRWQAVRLKEVIL